MYIIYNPVAGQRREKRLEAVLASLALRDIFPRLMKTEYAGHAVELARSVAGQKEVTVVAAGGDGTIAEVVSGLQGGKARLGIIPLGTANVLAHEFGIPFQPEAIAKILAEPDSRLLWPGLVKAEGKSDKIFVQMVSVGLDAQIVHNVHLKLKKLIGRHAYVFQTFRELMRYPFQPLYVEVDGHIYSAAGAIISKGRFYGGTYLLAQEACASKQGFVVTLFRRGGKIAALRFAWAILRNRLSSHPDVITLYASCVAVRKPYHIAVQADGDKAGMTPFEICDAETSVLVASSS